MVKKQKSRVAFESFLPRSMLHLHLDLEQGPISLPFRNSERLCLRYLLIRHISAFVTSPRAPKTSYSGKDEGEENKISVNAKREPHFPHF